MILRLKIDVTKIEKARLFKGEKGTYLDASILIKDDFAADQYGNCGMIVQDIKKEEREAGAKGAILGNVQLVGQAPTSKTAKPQVVEATQVEDDLPF